MNFVDLYRLRGETSMAPSIFSSKQWHFSSSWSQMKDISFQVRQIFEVYLVPSRLERKQQLCGSCVYLVTTDMGIDWKCLASQLNNPRQQRQAGPYQESWWVLTRTNFYILKRRFTAAQCRKAGLIRLLNLLNFTEWADTCLVTIPAVAIAHLRLSSWVTPCADILVMEQQWGWISKPLYRGWISSNYRAAGQRYWSRSPLKN